MRQDIQTGRLVVLVFLIFLRHGTIADKEQQLPQLVQSLACVALGVHPLTQGLVRQVPQEKDRFDEPPLRLEEPGQLMLARIGLQLADEQGGSDIPAFEGPCDPSEIVPSINETRWIHAACEPRLEPLINRMIVLELVESLMAQVPDTRGKLHAQPIKQRQHSIGIPCGICCLCQHRQVRLIVEDVGKDVRGLAERCRPHLRPVW